MTDNWSANMWSLKKRTDTLIRGTSPETCINNPLIFDGYYACYLF